MATSSNPVLQGITAANSPLPILTTEPIIQSHYSSARSPNGNGVGVGVFQGEMEAYSSYKTGHTIGPLPLRGRVAIVTGGSGGIGSEICRQLAQLGAKLVISYIGDPTPSDILLSEILQGIAVEADVSDPAQVKALFNKAEKAFGPQIHILVAAAGIQDSTYPALANTTLESFERTFNVNTKGTFLCIQEAANRLVRGGGGRIITLSSSNVGSLKPGYGVYAASKGAIEVMTRILAKELAGTGITANAVAPGPINTPMFIAGKTKERIQAAVSLSPMGRVGEPKDVAPLVGFLATDAAEWVNGQVIRINGGYV